MLWLLWPGKSDWLKMLWLTDINKTLLYLMISVLIESLRFIKTIITHLPDQLDSTIKVMRKQFETNWTYKLKLFYSKMVPSRKRFVRIEQKFHKHGLCWKKKQWRNILFLQNIQYITFCFILTEESLLYFCRHNSETPWVNRVDHK